MRISLCIIARDEEQMLPGCLESARHDVDEIIVIDTGSRDRTAEAARALGARVYSHRWRDDFSAARNASLDRATGDWVLVLDCDERLAPESRGAVRRTAARGGRDGYLLRITNSPAESWLALRLARHLPDLRYRGRIHERLNFQGPACVCDATILHLGYREERIAERDKRRRNLRLVEAACRETAAGPPEEHSFYLFYWAFGATGEERVQRLQAWVRYVEAHPALQESGAPPWIPVGLAHYAWQLSDAGKHEDAAALAAMLAGRHGESPLLHLVLARERAAAGHLVAAERHAGRAEAGLVGEPYQYFPIDYDLIRRRARRLLGSIRERQGRLADAERIYRGLLQADASDLPAALRLVCVLVQAGRHREALETLEAWPALRDVGLPEVDCLGYALSLSLSGADPSVWRERVAGRAPSHPLAAAILRRVSLQPPGVALRWSDFPELEAGLRPG